MTSSEAIQIIYEVSKTQSGSKEALNSVTHTLELIISQLESHKIPVSAQEIEKALIEDAEFCLKCQNAKEAA